MIIPSFSDCQRIVAEGQCVGMGSSRAAYIHDAFPGIVVKTLHHHRDPLSLGGQNLLEVKNFRRLMSEGLPANVRIPNTASVGGYVVQEYVEGAEPYDHQANEDWTGWVDCDCDEEYRLGYCWMEALAQISTDGFSTNARILNGEVWLIDLAY